MSFEYLNSFIEVLFFGYIFTLIFGLLAYPISNYLFNKYHDQGFNIAKIIGIFFIGYIYFTLVTVSSVLSPFIKINILELNSIYSWIVSVIAFVFIQKIYINLKFNQILSLYEQINLGKLVKFEIFFILLFSFFLYLNFGFKYRVEATETFMNFGILKSIQNSKELPLEDFWMKGEKLNYYYFGHLSFSQFQMLSKIDVDTLYYGICALIASLLCINSFIYVKRFSKFATIVVLPILIFLGPVSGVFEFLTYPINNDLQVFTTSIIMNNTRSLPDAISENFSYTFVFMQGHAHTYSLLLGILMMYLLTYIFENNYKLKCYKKHYLFFSFFLGIIFLTNSWDFVFYMGIFSFIYFFRNKNEILKNLKENFVQVELLVLISFIFIIPWKIFYEAPGLIPSLVHNRSSFYDLLRFWQFYLIIPLIYAIYNLKNYKNFKRDFFFQIFFYCILIIFLLEIFYIKDATFGRWNTYYKFSNQIFLAFSIICSIFLGRILRYQKFFYIKYILISLLIFCSMNFFIYVYLYFNTESFGKLSNMPEKYLKNKTEKKEAFEFLRTKYSNERPIIIEYPGLAYEDSNFFGTTLGYRSILGWANHEYTWRNYGKFKEPIEQRKKDIIEVYSGENYEDSKNILNKYQVNLIIVGNYEKQQLLNKINYKKLNTISKLIFENEEIKIYEYNFN